MISMSSCQKMSCKKDPSPSKDPLKKMRILRCKPSAIAWWAKKSPGPRGMRRESARIWAKTGSMKISFSCSENANAVSLWIYTPNVWKPNQREIQLKCEDIASWCGQILPMRFCLASR